jgi:hypothetical protein
MKGCAALSVQPFIHCTYAVYIFTGFVSKPPDEKPV